MLSILLCYPGLRFGAMILQAGHLDVGVIKGEVRDASPCHRNAAFYSAFSPRRQGIPDGSTRCTAKLFVTLARSSRIVLAILDSGRWECGLADGVGRWWYVPEIDFITSPTTTPPRIPELRFRHLDAPNPLTPHHFQHLKAVFSPLPEGEIGKSNLDVAVTVFRESSRDLTGFE